MSIKKEDLLNLACELRSAGAEPHWRSAVSRAYYAVYHGCTDWHKALPMPGSNTGPAGGVHQQLINRMRNPDTSTPDGQRKLSKMLATQLEVLRGQRHQADYNLGDKVDQALAANACQQAQAILAKI
jgi:uncharacterized protein (UPF0332 family)